ncbi:hypothetical protein [Nesterenkonia populi]|uniref:hypothetical protein n=1 Tax=Nesterenkonia populi TaxID=1591087 RepID=UPI0011BF994F|nr:hypothetical protein [Nesterenkonia populi]
MTTRGMFSDEQVSLHLQGVNLDDDRWESPQTRLYTHRTGVWELLTGTEVLPRYSGGRVTRWEIPGGQGERRAALMPLAARVIPIRIRVYPICTDPQSPMYQRQGRDPQERARFLRENITEFHRRVQLGRQMVDGNLRLDRTIGGTEQVSAAVYFESDWDQEDGPEFLWSTLTVPARNPTGTWFGAWETVDAGEITPDDGSVGLAVPAGDAPIEDARIAIRPIGNQPSDGENWFRLTNYGGTGFTASMLEPYARWWIVRAGESRAGVAPSGDNADRDWAMDTPREDVIYSYGRRQGTSLLITPGIPGDGRAVGRVNIRVGAPARVMVAVRPKYF